MALFLPFCGFRYDGARADRARLLAPPYDVIDAEQRQALAAHPENLVHLELPLQESGEPDRYAAAASRLAAWCAAGTLRRDPEPAYYVYSQTYTWAGRERERRAVIGLLELAAPGAASGIYPHETTLHGPREDRRRLLAATGANFSPLFFLAEDASGDLQASLQAVAQGSPLSQATTPWGTRERLWRWDGSTAQGAARGLAATPLVFADGHHRFASARDFAATARSGDSNGTAGFVLAAVVPMADPGLLVLPTHRILKREAGLDPEALESVLRTSFEIDDLEQTPNRSPAERAAVAEAWIESARVSGRRAFVLATAAHGERGLRLRPECLADLYADSGVDPRQQDLEVQLTQALLRRAFGLGVEEIAAREAIAYSHDAAETLGRVRDGEPAAFLLPATAVEDIVRVASAELLLPQKSTYFLPKLTSGWALHVHERPGESWRGSVWKQPSQEMAHAWLGAAASNDRAASR